MEYIIAHSAKGSAWKKHKYVTKVGNRYVYKDDVKRRRNKLSAQSKLQKAIKSGAKDEIEYQTDQIRALTLEQELADLNRPLTAQLEKTGLNMFQTLLDNWMETDLYKNYEKSKEHKEALEQELKALTEKRAEHDKDLEEKKKEEEYNKSRQGKLRNRLKSKLVR